MTTSADQFAEAEALMNRWLREKWQTAPQQAVDVFKKLRDKLYRYKGPAHSSKLEAVISELRSMLSEEWTPPP